MLICCATGSGGEPCARGCGTGKPCGRQANGPCAGIPRAGLHLLVSDAVLPGGMNGIELARAARRLRQDLKVLLPSGYPGQIWASESGAEEFDIFPKPYRQQELAAKIEGLFCSAGSKEPLEARLAPPDRGDARP